MRNCILFLVCFLGVALAQGADVNIGTTNAMPGQFAQCNTLIAGVSDLGTDPTDGQINTGIGDLEAGTVTMLRFEDTTLPAGLCTVANSCTNAAVTTCTKKSLSAQNSRVVYDAAGVPIICSFQCVDPAIASAMKYWVVVGCP